MTIYSFIAEEQANHSIWTVTEMCRVLTVSRSGFYDWHGRGPSERELSDRRLALEIEAIWECSDRTYGVPRVHRWLLKQDAFVEGRYDTHFLEQHLDPTAVGLESEAHA